MLKFLLAGFDGVVDFESLMRVFCILIRVLSFLLKDITDLPMSMECFGI